MREQAGKRLVRADLTEEPPCDSQEAAFPENLQLMNRRPGEGRGLMTLTILKSLGPGLRRDDELSNIAAN
jgi:hypothetical protein